MLFCLSFALLLAAPDVHAQTVGYYSGPTYSGGATNAASYGSYNGGWGGISGTAHSASCNGEITASFPWNAGTANAPVPQSVIVTQTSTAAGSGAAYSSSRGSEKAASSDGLGDTGTSHITFIPPQQEEVNGNNCTRTTYTVKPGASPLSVTCSPSSSGSSPNGPVSASVTYTASVSPVIITISGTYDPTHGDYHVLTGQQITASLSGIVGTVTSYTWSVNPSATVFKDYDFTLPSNQLVPLGSADLTGPATGSTTVAALNFYDRTQENLTVTCTASVTAPDGTPLSVTATSPQINVLKPTAIWNVNSTTPFGAQFDPTATGSMSFAVLWNASVTVPSPFSGGFGCFAQIVYPTIDFQRHPSGNQPINCYLKEPQTNADGTTSYVLPTTGLDTYFPYQASSTQFYPKGYIWDVSGTGQSGDQPGAGFATPASDNGGNNWYAAFDSDTFTTWLMYMPPSSTTGSGMTIWVPLQRVDWSWTGNVVKDATTGIWNPATNGSAVTGSSSSPGIPVDTPPQWNTVNVGTNVLRP